MFNCPVTKETVFLNLKATTKAEVIRYLCGHLFILNKSDEPLLLYQDIIRREQIVSTYAGSRTCIPHAITKHVTEPVLCFARMSGDDFTWDGKDEAVKFVFLLFAPEQSDLPNSKQNMSYIFSSIAQLIIQPNILELWESSKDKQIILGSLNQAFTTQHNNLTES